MTRALCVALALSALSARAGPTRPGGVLALKRSRVPAAEDDPRLGGRARAFSRAKVAFAAPEDGAQLPRGAVPVRLQISGYALGGPGRAHAHLIVDNLPALEVDAAGPFVLRGLSPGPHTLRAVLCRPWHEVVKAPGAFALVRFWVGRRYSGRAGELAEKAVWPDRNRPLLTYVLPLGQPDPRLELLRAGDEASAGSSAEKDPSDPPPPQADDPPQFDFYLSGAKLGRRGYKVRIVVDRRELPLTTDWAPRKLTLEPGAHRITLDLLDRKGRKVKGPLNRTDRTFELK